ncbi:iron-containing alcohol dehydrogenase family protein [Geomicrobium sp. JCM 19038]|uniref:iron-containing alcohol dehydrogenase family protein n=1 Tax=Geomicrobium sp. JCM 19038 TaxID=1460635 RepID=UPI00045F1AA1|nr:iron-containing alcohol dehydrogenase [Geomicrobium sp. JCM 19038]GAK07618.1 alcohol dehydrogenase [Geomicrobium sp. JCM 19038]
MEIIPQVAEATRNLHAVISEKEPGEPTISNVEDVAQQLKASGADVIVAIGGGSVMDSAKAARLVVSQDQSLRTFIQSEQTVRNPEIALITVPTTAGTGSEVSGGAVITDEDRDVKVGIADSLLRAQHAIVDPVLTYNLPRTITAYTGIDAVAQAIAAVMSNVRTPIGNAIALEAIRLASDALIKVVADGTDYEARSNMACASLMAGLSMNIANCTAEHSIGQALGGMYHLPHGLTIGLVLAETMERERKHIPELMERIADALGAEEDGSQDGTRAVRAVRELLSRIEIPTLREVGARVEDLERLAEQAMDDYFITMAPVPWTKEEVIQVFEKLYELEKR